MLPAYVRSLSLLLLLLLLLSGLLLSPVVWQLPSLLIPRLIQVHTWNIHAWLHPPTTAD